MKDGSHCAGDLYSPLYQPAPGDLVFTGPPDAPALTVWPGDSGRA